MKISYLSLNAEACLSLAAQWGFPKFRGDQLKDWLYGKRVRDPALMLNLPKEMREKLAENFSWHLPEIVESLDSPDGSTKLLMKTDKGQLIETVILRYDERVSLCVSSQVGCKLACSFCQTGKLGFVRHLSREEILAQYVYASEVVSREGRRVSHVVFMGMGEPFDNYENSVGAANTLISEHEFGLSARHVTLSTSGMVPRIYDLIKDSRASLAVSLHASRDELRTELMPINRKYDLASLKEALMAYQKQTGRKITIEYILIRGKNCGVREAKELVKFIHGLRVKVNLIPFNTHPGLGYERPDADEVRQFQKYLADRSIPAPVRYSKGLDVSAACGQLAAKREDQLGSQPARSFALDRPLITLQ